MSMLWKSLSQSRGGPPHPNPPVVIPDPWPCLSFATAVHPPNFTVMGRTECEALEGRQGAEAALVSRGTPTAVQMYSCILDGMALP